MHCWAFGCQRHNGLQEPESHGSAWSQGIRHIKDPKRFMQATRAQKKRLTDHVIPGRDVPKYSTQVLMIVINEPGAMPTRHYARSTVRGVYKIFSKAMHEPCKRDDKADLVNNAYAKSSGIRIYS